jgi:hypothetical protein
MAWVVQLDVLILIFKAGAAIDLTEAEWIAMYNELKDTPGARLSGPHRESYETPGPHGFMRSATFTDVIYASDAENCSLVWTPIPLCIDEEDSLTKLLEIFSIPRLPWTNHLAYVVESERALQTMNKVLRMHREGIDIDPLMLAAGMEELRIN